MKKPIKKGAVFYTYIKNNNTNKRELRLILIIKRNKDYTFNVLPIESLINNKEFNVVEVVDFSKIRPNSFIIVEDLLIIKKESLLGYCCILNSKTMKKVNSMLPR